MSDAKFSKLLDYETLNSNLVILKIKLNLQKVRSKTFLNLILKNVCFPHPNLRMRRKPGLTGSRLRSYAFAVLTRKEYSKAELIEKLALYAAIVMKLLTWLKNCPVRTIKRDQRVAETMLSSQKRKGKGPNQIKMKLKSKKIDTALISEEPQRNPTGFNKPMN